MSVKQSKTECTAKLFANLNRKRIFDDPEKYVSDSGLFSSKALTVLGNGDINSKELKCTYTVKDYGYEDSTKIVKSYLTGE